MQKSERVSFEQSLGGICLIKTENLEILDRLALELCPEDSSESAETGWKCAKACDGCKNDITNVLNRLKIEALAAGKVETAEWVQVIANPAPVNQYL